MKKSTRGLLIEFTEKLNENNKIGKLDKKINDALFNLAENITDDKLKSIIIDLENNFIAYRDLIKYQYFDYGVIAANLEEERDLNWEPKGIVSFSEVRQ